MKLDNFINRPVLSTVISIFIVLLGIIGLFALPVTQYPDIAPPTISVQTSYTGANAQTVLNSVIAPLEEQINGRAASALSAPAPTNAAQIPRPAPFAMTALTFPTSARAGSCPSPLLLTLAPPILREETCSVPLFT